MPKTTYLARVSVLSAFVDVEGKMAFITGITGYLEDSLDENENEWNGIIM